MQKIRNSPRTERKWARGCMGPVDMSLTRMEKRSAERKARLVNLREKEIIRRHDQFSILENSNSSNEDNYTDDSTSLLHVVNTRPRNTMDLGLAATLDRRRLVIVMRHLLLQQPQRVWGIKLGT